MTILGIKAQQDILRYLLQLHFEARQCGCVPWAAVAEICIWLQAHVHQMAVAAGDVYVRVYDRRMLSEGT